jgi:enamine deaminase RidA (YjgF/YER057c/UK114 family)
MAHSSLNPEGLGPPVGFSHVVVPAAGRTVYLAGQTAHGPDGAVRGEDLVAEFRYAVQNVARALGAAEARPEHVVSLWVFCSDPEGYRANLRAIGAAYREVFGDHYPAMAWWGVTELFDPRAHVELIATAVIPE